MIPVAVTGIGAVSALGADPAEIFERLLEGERALGPAPWPCPRPEQRWRAALVPGPRRAASTLALDAARQALGDRDPRDVVIVCGTSAADMAEGEAAWMAWRRGDPVAEGALLWPQLADRPAEAVRAALGCRPPAHAVSTACTAGAVAISVAADLVRLGRAPAALAIGVDALCQLTWYGFGALSLQADGPCKPFDIKRNGLNLGEGAGALLIEPTDTSRPPLALLRADASGADASSLTAPHPQGRGLRDALEGVRKHTDGPLGWIHAHATGTPQNDRIEVDLLAELHPDVPVSGTKGSLGHTLGAAGALGAAMVIRSLHRGWIPPSVGTEQPEPGLALVRSAQRLRARRALSLAAGFGGGATAHLWEGA